jgi:hypothetical protein
MRSLRSIEPTVRDGITTILGAQFWTPESAIQLYATGLQESRFEVTHQIGGPAHSWFQIEKGGAAINVLTHRATRELALKACAARHVKPTIDHVFAALEHDQIFASCFARLEYWTNPNPLPLIGQVNSAWDYYIATWRPGHPHRKTWDAFYWRAVGFVAG